MKHRFPASLGMILSTGMILFTGHLYGQATAQPRAAYTVSAGLFGKADSDVLYITNEGGSEPVRYLHTDETAYLDEKGNPVAMTSLKSGQPVTVHYSIVADTLIVSKVTLRKAVVPEVVGPTAVESVTMSHGTISTFARDRVVVTSPSTRQPVAYLYSEGTVYVDEAGDPVSVETVKVGLPVTIYYSQSGNLRTANRIVVRNPKDSPETSIGKQAAAVSTLEL